ncbi:hypothetical protein I5907_21210 [Panacibacter sp. DH6]|uniref:Transcriptional regulator n=1 Tax=Panacibacter microcysteis TaxID=2793269 RepID=A0A931H0H8_9BACT|nr:hypothetical protein [Panacibacter microcysteis]MBG9378765.1 hypothetical protein [Panacibacter microcysteis]
MTIEQALQPYKGQAISMSILMDLLKDYLRPHNKIQELEKQHMLTRIKRGLYITGDALQDAKPSLFNLANHIYGPSYVSLEAALSHWGLIPERVTAIGSMTTGSTRTFRTAAGLFRYFKTRLPYYSFGIRRVVLAKDQTALIAGPEKALCDVILTRTGVLLRSVSQTQFFLEEDLRMEREPLRTLDREMIRSWLPDAAKQNSLRMLIKTLEAL